MVSIYTMFEFLWMNLKKVDIKNIPKPKKMLKIA